MTRNLSDAEARLLRWHAHQLGGSTLTPSDAVERAVALQGQDLPAVLRAIAIRSRPGTTVADVRAAFDSGSLVRSWPMRGTLFATTPERLAHLRHFTAARTHQMTVRRREQLGLDAATLTRALDLLTAALAERPRRRAEALKVWEQAGISTASGRGYHLLFHAAVDGLAHWGAFDETGTEQLFTATPPAPALADPDAALTAIVQDYIAARGPVTEADLAWWIKLPKSLLRPAIARADDIVSVSVEGSPAFVVGDPALPADPVGVTLVPAFDEWILGYGDRSLVASERMLQALVPGSNGVFRPAVLVEGRVVATWRLPAARSATAPRTMHLDLVESVPAATRRAIDRALSAWPHA